MRFSLFKPLKNNTFNYIPRYYDERKERLENLRKKYQNLPDNTSFAGERQRINFRDEWNSRKVFKPAGNNAGRFFVILAILCAIAFFIIKLYGLEYLFFNG